MNNLTSTATYEREVKGAILFLFGIRYEFIFELPFYYY